MKKAPKITVICDDREKHPWDEDYLGPEFRLQRKRLLVGDYTLKGFECVFRIERKASWQEFASNICTRKGRENLVKVLRGLSKFPYRYFIVQADFSKIMRTRYFSRYTGGHDVQDWLVSMSLEYGVPVLSLGNRYQSQHFIRMLFLRFLEFNAAGRLHHNGKVS